MSGENAVTSSVEFDEKQAGGELADRCASLVGHAEKRGADEAEAYASSSQTISVKFEKDDLKLTQVDESSSIGLRVFTGKKLGFSATNQTDDSSLERTASDALSLAALNPAEEENRLPSPKALPERPSLIQPELVRTTVEEAVGHGRDFVGRVLGADPRISIESTSFTVSRSTYSVVSSTGVRAFESDASAGLSLFGMAIDGDDVGGFHATGDSVRDLAELPGAIEASVSEFVEIVLGNLGAGAAESYTGPVVFSPNALMSIFLSPMLSACSAIAVQRGRSALAGKLGESVAASSLSIVDDPSDTGLGGATAFDREGQPAERMAIVENGILQTYLYNGYAANVDGRESTGHASGGARSVPGLGPHSIQVAAGDGGSLEDLFRRMGRGLYVQRFSGTVDPASGDFSGVAKSARWIEPGKDPRPVKETLLSGNAFELLRNDFVLGSTAERRNGSFRAPAALFDGVSVTAG